MGIHSEADKKAAIRVLKQSRQVRNWLAGQMSFFGLDPESKEGKEFAEREGTKLAERLIR